MPTEHTPEQIEEIIKGYLSEEFLACRPDITIDSDFNIVAAGVLDSLGVLRLVTFLEERFCLAIHPTDIALRNFQSVGAICSFVTTKRA